MGEVVETSRFGTGTRLLGHSRRDATGRFTATRWGVVLRVPLLPLARARFRWEAGAAVVEEHTPLAWREALRTWIGAFVLLPLAVVSVPVALSVLVPLTGSAPAMVLAALLALAWGFGTVLAVVAWSDSRPHRADAPPLFGRLALRVAAQIGGLAVVVGLLVGVVAGALFGGLRLVADLTGGEAFAEALAGGRETGAFWLASGLGITLLAAVFGAFRAVRGLDPADGEG